MSPDRASSLPPRLCSDSFWAFRLDNARALTPGPNESVIFIASSANSTSDTDFCSSLDTDCDDEEVIAEKAGRTRDPVEEAVPTYMQHIFPMAERDLKARTERRQKINQAICAMMADIEECKKYTATLKKLEEELDAARAEGRRLQDTFEKSVESASLARQGWFLLGNK